MPFIAINAATGERLDASEFTLIHSELAARGIEPEQLRCQLCAGAMYARQGPHVPHFAHYPDVDCNSHGYETKPESPEHHVGKRFVRDHLRTLYPGAQVELEVPIEQRKRIADVLVAFRGGWAIAHEIQLARIALTELEERTRDYARVGIDVVWWLGAKAPHGVRQWVSDRQPLYLLEFEEITDEQDAASHIEAANRVSTAAHPPSAAYARADEQPSS